MERPKTSWWHRHVAAIATDAWNECENFLQKFSVQTLACDDHRSSERIEFLMMQLVCVRMSSTSQLRTYDITFDSMGQESTWQRCHPRENIQLNLFWHTFSLFVGNWQRCHCGKRCGCRHATHIPLTLGQSLRQEMLNGSTDRSNGIEMLHSIATTTE